MIRVVLMALLLGAAAPLMAAKLALYTEEHPPFSQLEQGELGGISVQVINELMRRTGEQLTIELLPWTRSYARALNGANVGVFPMVRSAAREAQFLWVGPLTNSRTAIYTRRSDGLQVRSVEDLGVLGTIAVPKRWSSYEYFEQLALPNLYGVESQRDMLRMFQYGRINVLTVDVLSLAPLLQSESIAADDVQWQFDLMPVQGYLAFSLVVNPERVARWQAQLDAMRADRTLRRIYRQALPELTPAQLTQLVDAPAPMQLATEQ